MSIHEWKELPTDRRLRDDWRRLLSLTPQATFFQSWDWLNVRQRFAPADTEMRILEVEEHGITTGFVPLSLQTESTKLGPVRILALPLDGWGSFYSPIGADPARLLGIAIEYLSQQSKDYDLVDLRPLRIPGNPPPSSATGSREPHSDLAPHTELGLSHWTSAAMIDLDKTWESYWQSRKVHPNRRRNVERCERRLQELGEIEFVRYRPKGVEHGETDPNWAMFENCVDLAAKSWQSGLVEGNTLSHGSVRDFLRSTHQVAVDAGALDMSLLRLNGEPIAFGYGYHYQGYVDLTRIGFDPQWNKLAPGNALWTRLIRDSFERKDHLIDLGPTCLDYKIFWLTRMEASQRILRYTRSPRAQLLRISRWLKGRSGVPVESTNAQARLMATEAKQGEADASGFTIR